MPKIPTRSQRVQRTATVGQAPLPLDIADTGAQAIGQGLAQLGAGVTNIGIATKQAEQKRQDILDMTARLDMTSQMNASDATILTKMETEQDPTNWDSFRQEELLSLQSSIEANTSMSDKEKGLSLAILGAWDTEKTSQLKLAETRQIVDTGQKTSVAALEMAYANGKASDIAIAEDAWNLMSSELYPNKVLAKEVHDDAVARGKKQFNDANVDLWRNHASVNPELTKSVLEDERADRKEGKGVVSEEALSDEDITDIIKYSNTVADIDKARRKEEKRDLINETTSKAIGNFYKGELDEKELVRQHDAGLIKDVNFEKMINGLRKVSPEVSDPFASAEIRRVTLDLAAGSIDREKAESTLLDEYPKL